jgi:hypothetical protein
MHKAGRWVAYAFAAWLLVNAIAYPLSYLIPKARQPQALFGTILQNFNFVLLIGFVIVIIFADVLYITHIYSLKDDFPAEGNVVKGDLIGTIIEFDYPLFITALFLLIEIMMIYMVAF